MAPTSKQGKELRPRLAKPNRHRRRSSPEQHRNPTPERRPHNIPSSALTSIYRLT